MPENEGFGKGKHKRGLRLFCILRLLLRELRFAILGDDRELALFALHETEVDEEVVDRVGWLGTLAQPVLGTLDVEVHFGWLGEGVVGSEDLEGLTPWITGFFTHDKAVRWLLFLPDTGKTNGQHGRIWKRRIAVQVPFTRTGNLR